MARQRLLIVDDDADIRDVLRLTLEAAQYAVIDCDNGETAIELAKRDPPDLLIVDYQMPKLNGQQVCEALKKDLLLRHIPIIMLTGQGAITEKVRGLDAGADDYIVKPFEPRELLARVRMILRRTAQGLEANPLTRLPGNVSIHQELQDRLADRQPFAVLYLDLDKFKAFNDRYGFERGDEAIHKTAQILLGTVKRLGNPDDFIGHIGGDDFVIVTTSEKAERLAQQIITAFDAMSPMLYDEEDRQRGYILSKDRKGQEQRFGLLTISIAIVTSEGRHLTHVAQIGELGAELKSYAKTFDKSIYVNERRTDTATHPPASTA